MIPHNPLGDTAGTDRDDLALLRDIQNGSRQALEELIARHPASGTPQAFMKAGYVDPHNLAFAASHVQRVRDVASRVHTATGRTSSRS